MRAPKLPGLLRQTEIDALTRRSTLQGLQLTGSEGSACSGGGKGAAGLRRLPENYQVTCKCAEALSCSPGARQQVCMGDAGSGVSSGPSFRNDILIGLFTVRSVTQRAVPGWLSAKRSRNSRPAAFRPPTAPLQVGSRVTAAMPMAIPPCNSRLRTSRHRCRCSCRRHISTMPPLPLLRRAPPCPSAMRFVVVGGGVAGVCCAEELCRLRPQDEVTLVSASRVLKASQGGWETTVDSQPCCGVRTGTQFWVKM